MNIPLPHPLYVLVIDHRQPWVEWCDQHGVDRLRIREVKTLAADAFLLARRDSMFAMESGALLVDRQSGAEAFVRARAGGAVVGTPAERDGVFPLEWTDALDKTLRGAFAKVLVRHGADVAGDIVESQLAKLAELHEWCSSTEKPLVVEVRLSGATQDSALHCATRVRLLADYIRDAYARGIVPQYWLIEGNPESASMRAIDGAIRERDGPGLLILADGAAPDTVATWFESAHGMPDAAGFSVGRTVYWDAACEFLLGRLAADDAVHAMAANYRTVIDLWRLTAPPRFS
jgi:5-dehydro-2-deoxygluconokinase